VGADGVGGEGVGGEGVGGEGVGGEGVGASGSEAVDGPSVGKEARELDAAADGGAAAAPVVAIFGELGGDGAAAAAEAAASAAGTVADVPASPSPSEASSKETRLFAFWRPPVRTVMSLATSAIDCLDDSFFNCLLSSTVSSIAPLNTAILDLPFGCGEVSRSSPAVRFSTPLYLRSSIFRAVLGSNDLPSIARFSRSPYMEFAREASLVVVDASDMLSSSPFAPSLFAP
jgi:hypothetical protein